MSDLLTCKKCNQNFDSSTRKPMLGTCGHSVCSACRNQLLLNKKHVCERCGTLMAFEKENLNMDISDILNATSGTDDRNSSSIFLKNFPMEWNEKELQNLCSVYGEIGSVRILVGPTGKSKGMAFINYTETASAKKALEMNGVSIGKSSLYAILQGQNNPPKAKAAGNNQQNQQRPSSSTNEKQQKNQNTPRNAPKSKGPPPQQQKPQKSDPECTIFVRNFAPTCNEAELRKIFQVFGNINNCTIKTAEDSQHKYAFVNFTEGSSAQRAVACTGKVMQADKPLYISLKTNKPAQEKEKAQTQRTPTPNSNKGKPSDVDNRTVYMSNVPPYWAKERVAHLASASGVVAEVQLSDRDHFVMAKIIYTEPEAAARLFALNGFEIENRTLHVARKPPTPVNRSAASSRASTAVRDMGIDQDYPSPFFTPRSESSRSHFETSGAAFVIGRIPPGARLATLYSYFSDLGEIVDTAESPDRTEVRIVFSNESAVDRISAEMPIILYGTELKVQRVFRW